MEPLGQSQVLPYIKGLSKKGIKFYLISLEKKKDIKESIRIRGNLESLRINWYKLRYFGHHPIKILFSIFQCFLVAFYLVISKKIEMIHARAYYSVFVSLPFKKLFKIKLIFDMRGFGPEEFVDAGSIKKDSIYYKLLKFLERKSILLADYLITLTPEAAEIIKNEYKKLAIDWMPTCVDEDRFKTEEPIFLLKNRFVMVYSGSLWSWYNINAMIDFFNVLKIQIPSAHFLILSKDKNEKLYPLFSDKGLQKGDYTVIEVEPDKVPRYLKGSNLGISFTYNTYSKKASFPTKIAEYLISGLPIVINTQFDFLKNLITTNKIGIIIENFDKETFQKEINNLVSLLRDPNLKERCEQTARKYLGKNVCLNKYLEIYRKLIASKTCPKQF